MFEVIAGLLLGLYILVFYSYRRMVIREIEFTINHLIKIGKTYKMIIETDECGENPFVKKVKLFEGERELDSEISQYKESTFFNFFIGKEGFYVYNKFIGKLYCAKDIKELSALKRRVFKKFFILNDKS